MANKSKHSGFVNAANKLVEDVFQRRAGEALSSSANDTANEQKLLRLALSSGDFSKSDIAQQALSQYIKLLSEGNEMAEAAGYTPDSQDYKDFSDYYVYSFWPQDMPVSYEDFYNANSKRLANSEAKGLEAQRKAQDKRVADFQAAMQNIDPTTGMSYDELGAQGAQSRAELSSWFKPKVSPVYDANVDAVSGAQQTHAPNVWEPGYFGKP